jgi:hypothetical protein
MRLLQKLACHIWFDLGLLIAPLLHEHLRKSKMTNVKIEEVELRNHYSNLIGGEIMRCLAIQSIRSVYFSMIKHDKKWIFISRNLIIVVKKNFQTEIMNSRAHT